MEDLQKWIAEIRKWSAPGTYSQMDLNAALGVLYGWQAGLSKGERGQRRQADFGVLTFIWAADSEVGGSTVQYEF